MAQLRQTKDSFDAAGAQVVLVGMGTRDETAAFAKRFAVPFPLVCDPDKKLYRAFELKRMPAWHFLSPTVALKGVAAMAQGHVAGLPQGDVRQLPGVFIIGSGGRILFSHHAQNPADHPLPEAIIEVLKTVV